MINVMINLDALASGIGKQDADMLFNFYWIASERLLETQEEREAFRLGALAMFADEAGYKIRAAYYRRKFCKAVEKLRK